MENSIKKQKINKWLDTKQPDSVDLSWTIDKNYTE